jgi:hypothetical protein
MNNTVSGTIKQKWTMHTRIAPEGHCLYRLPDGRFHVECNIDVRFESIRLHGSLEIVPVLEHDGFRLELPMLVLMGWRRYFGFVMTRDKAGWCSLLKEYRIGRISCVSVPGCLCGRMRCRYEADIGYQPWMDKAGMQIAQG